MRFILKTVFTLATLAVLVIGAMAFLVPTDLVRDQAIALIKEQTGRTLTVGGETSFTFYPGIGVQLGDVTLSNPPGMKGPPMLRMASLTLSMEFLPLLSRSVQIERFILLRPVFDLQVDGKGRRNWDFSRKTADAGSMKGRVIKVMAKAAEARTAQAMPRYISAQAGGPGDGAIQDIRLGSVRIEQGIVLYTDAKLGKKQRFDAVNISLKQKNTSAPVNAKGNLVWRGEKIDFNGQIGTITALTRGGPSAVKADISSVLGKTMFNGRVILGDAFSAAGVITGNTPSVRELAAWAGNPLASSKGFGPASISGTLNFKNNVLTFSKMKVSLDGMNGQGNGSVSLKGAKPYIRAAFAIDKLDLNAYVGPGGPLPKVRRTAPQPIPAPGSVPAKPKKGQSLTDFIDDLNKKPAKPPIRPEVRAWSRRAMNFAGLNTVDADINLNAGALLYEQLKVGRNAVSASLKKGVLTANLTKLQLYGGSGTGRVTLNGARAVPAFATTFDLRGVSALPILKDAIKFKWISGRANLTLNISGSGRSQSDIVRTLHGNGSLNFTNGAIEGINIPAMVRGFKQGKIGGWKEKSREKTDFSSLSGTFTMQNGVASNSDLKLIGPLIRINGQGIVSLAGERIDYSMSPRLVASLQGQGSQQPLEGIVIPVRIHGPWSHPKVTPDLKKILENPEAVADTVNKIGKGLKGLKGKKITGKDVENILQGVLGGGQQPATEQGQAQSGEPQKLNAEDIFKQLFKKK